MRRNDMKDAKIGANRHGKQTWNPVDLTSELQQHYQVPSLQS